MADLGTITLRDPFPPIRPALLPISHYRIIRGRFLGTVALRNPVLPVTVLVSIAGPYIVRQIRIIYRQLWPSHGQRFPQ